MKPNQNEGDPSPMKDRNSIYVLEGQLTVQIGETLHTLDAFDSIMVDSRDPALLV